MLPKLIRSISTTIEEGIMSSFTSVAFRRETLVKKTPIEGITLRLQHAAKRIMDVTVAMILFLMSIPLFIVISVAIKVMSGGPILFSQQRIGHQGKRFTIFKFSTMHADNSDEEHKEYVKELLEEGNENGQNGEVISKYIEYVDSRTTKVGRILRATSLDELPQLINILKGDMSLVGPRPHPVYEVGEYKKWYRRRLTVKPGLTGWSKINLRLSLKNYEESILYDLWYVDNWSLWLDMRILLMTVPFVLMSREAR